MSLCLCAWGELSEALQRCTSPWALENAPQSGKNVGSAQGGEVLSASLFDVGILWVEYECGIPQIQLP